MYVNADMPLLQQAIVNIVKNAVESISGNGNRDGVIHIATENENGSVTLTICNNGAEISEETASRLFQPVLLDKAFRTRAGAHGSVGGVAQARLLVLAAHGQDSLTRFTIRFPGQRGGEVPPSRECRQEASLQEYRALSRWRSWEVTGSPVPNDSVAIKSDTVKPIPPSNETAARLPHVEPSGIGAHFNNMHNAAKRKNPEEFTTYQTHDYSGAMPWNSWLISMLPKKDTGIGESESGTMM